MQKNIFIIILVLILLASGVGLWQLKKNEIEENPIDKVAKHIILPKEIPIMATVTDKNQLNDQEFLKNANNGDVILIFRQLKKAILYRPATDKIVEVGPLTILDTSGQIATTTGLVAEARLVILNGTDESGLAKRFGREVFSKIDNLRVVEEKDAAEKYEKTQVVVLNNRFRQVAEGIAMGLKTEVGSMPLNEEIPDADIVIILGKIHP